MTRTTSLISSSLCYERSYTLHSLFFFSRLDLSRGALLLVCRIFVPVCLELYSWVKFMEERRWKGKVLKMRLEVEVMKTEVRYVPIMSISCVISQAFALSSNLRAHKTECTLSLNVPGTFQYSWPHTTSLSVRCFLTSAADKLKHN